MAVTLIPVFNGLHVQVTDVEADDDADTVAVIPHNLQAVPFVSLTNLQQAAGELSAWAATTITDSQVVMTKSTAGGSGAGGAQLRVRLMAPQAPILG